MTMSSLFSAPQLVEVAEEVWYWTGKPMTNIFRPAQQLNGRIVYKSTPYPSPVALPFLANAAVLVLPGSMMCLCSFHLLVSLSNVH